MWKLYKVTCTVLELHAQRENLNYFIKMLNFPRLFFFFFFSFLSNVSLTLHKCLFHVEWLNHML